MTLQAHERVLVARALTLAERLALFRQHPGCSRATAQTEQRLAAWRASSGARDGAFERRLGWEGLDIAAARAIAGEPDLPDDAPAPPWLEVVRDVRGGRGDAEHTPAATPTLVFQPCWEPWLAVARWRAAAALGARRWGALPEAARDGLGQLLLLDLCEAGVFALMHELQLRRLPAQRGNQLFLAQIAPTPPTAIFDALVRETHGAAALLDDYPCLLRLAATRVLLWVDMVCELVERLDADRAALEDRFAAPGRGLGQLVEIRGLGSDSHDGGRRVLLVSFERGEVIYKPRNLADEAAFAALTGWVNDATGRQLSSPRVLDRGGHGWVERAFLAPCADGAEIAAYYERTGALLALLYLLGATDCHQDNVIACGAHPVIIDLETVVAPLALGQTHDQPSYVQAVRRFEHESVLRVGLLPGWSLAPGRRMVDVSALGASRDSHGTRWLWRHPNTDLMVRVERPYQTHLKQSEPRLADLSTAPAAQHLERVLSGFDAVYALALAQRDTLLDGPLAPFRAIDARLVLRDTQLYGRLLRESCSAEALRDGFARGVRIDRLAMTLLDDAADRSAAVLAAESAALERGDVPVFRVRADGRCLRVYDRRFGALRDLEQAPVERSGWAALEQRVASLDEADRQWQTQCIACSFVGATVSEDMAPREGATLRQGEPDESSRRGDGAAAFDPLRATEAGTSLARALRDSAVSCGDEARYWLGLGFSGGVERVGVLGPWLYGGQLGIALALAAAYAASADDSLRQASLAALAPLRAGIDVPADEAPRDIGAFEGLSGLIYTCHHAARLLDDTRLADDARRALALITPAAIDEADEYDVIGGVAGCILALRALADDPSAAATARRIIERCGNRLLAASVQQPAGGVGWPTRREPRPLCGISHGNAGIALALLEAWRCCGAADLHQAALAALVYERAFRDDARGGWRDLRHPNAPPAQTWCHGTPGIALARACALAIDDRLSGVGEDLALALDGLRRARPAAAHLCCGEAGVDDALLELGKLLGDDELTAQARRQCAARLARAESIGGWPLSPGLPLELSMPSLMKGSAGIALGLLRLGDADAQLPCVLRLEP